MNAAQLATALRVQYGCAPEDAERAAARTLGHTPPAPVVAKRTPTIASGSIVRPAAVGARTERGGLELSLHVAPRTKKNGRKGGFGGIKQGPAYKAYRDAIVAMVAPLKGDLRLPLPERPYNIAVTYYVDRYGKAADKCGLDQGLYDALENAGVVTNDWQFRTDDGTRIVIGDASPRVELTITPIEAAR